MRLSLEDQEQPAAKRQRLGPTHASRRIAHASCHTHACQTHARTHMCDLSAAFGCVHAHQAGHSPPRTTESLRDGERPPVSGRFGAAGQVGFERDSFFLS